jgi:hypothetical protein
MDLFDILKQIKPNPILYHKKLEHYLIYNYGLSPAEMKLHFEIVLTYIITDENDKPEITHCICTDSTFDRIAIRHLESGNVEVVGKCCSKWLK